MPVEKKAQWARLKVGIMAIVAMIVLGVLVFLLTGRESFWSNKATVYTYMDDSAALAPGSPVRLNGILIGSVEKVGLSGLTQPNRIVRLDLRIAEDYFAQIPVDSVAAIASENALGTKFINIKKGTSQTTVRPGAEIQALDTRDFDDVVQQGYSLLASLQGALKRIDAIIGQVEVGKGTIGKLLVDETLYNQLVSIVGEVRKVAVALSSGQGTAGKLIYDDALYTDIRKSLGRVDGLLEGLQAGEGTAGKLVKDPALYNETRQTIAEVRTLLADLNAGKGSAGRLLKTDELHNQVSGVIRKLDTTMDKLNSGQGTLGQLLVNPAMYDNLNGTTVELQGLLKDFRANPKKFLRIKLALF
ncbi:MAG: MlaD family protein [Bryobacteraceae bacterium]|nr:MlaD family protein [Bryobacteraceae bacterium]